MNKVLCPHCEYRCDDESDWLYDNDLYQDDVEKEVTCPECKEKFAIKSWTTFEYETAETLEDL